MKRIFNRLLILFLLTNAPQALAEGSFNNINFANPFHTNQIKNVSYTSNKATLTHNDISNQYLIAFDRFMQSNVKSSYDNFEFLIETMTPSDYGYLQIFIRLSDIGFFNLADRAATKINDKSISANIIEDAKIYYFPTQKLRREDELYLGEIYSNMIYNNQSVEATNELVKNIILLQNSDYANFIAALGYMKSNDLDNATKYIDNAIAINPQNLNYKKLQAEILAQNNQTKDALKIVEYIKNQPMYSKEFSDYGNSIEQLILYKTEKNNSLKMYHLGYYYYYEKELNKSIRILQSAISNKNNINKNVYPILAKAYFDNEDFEKAQDIASKALKLDNDNSTTLMVLGDLCYKNEDFESALKYYQKASSKDKHHSLPLIKTAMTYEKLNEIEKAYQFYDKILKSYSDAYIAYYKIALKDQSKEVSYLKKAIAINLQFNDAWLELGRVAFEQGRYNEAHKYLSVAKYIDENDFKYYYYQGLLYKKQGMQADATQSFKRSLILNPDYEPTKKELKI
ncbi:MAG: tetratricopeptide repeat protein [Candidatus Gastranaerophilales bacterium]